jgi:hypothetical protein
MFIASKPSGSDAGSPFGLVEQIPGEQCLSRDDLNAQNLRLKFPRV